MKFSEIKTLSDNFIIPSYGRIEIAFDRGEGAYLIDVSGKRYLDFVSGLAVTNLGHAHPRITQVICEQAGRLLHTSNFYFIENQAKLAQIIADKALDGKTFFCNSGAEANESAIKLARFYGNGKQAGKNRILSLKNSFHGRTLGALTMTGQSVYQKGFDPLLGNFHYIEPNDISDLAKNMGHDVAALFLEVVQGESGVHPLSEEYVKKARELCTKYKALLIIDEVQTGMGRTGTWFGFQQYGILPDAITMAKALANGLPIGALHVTPEFQDVLQPKSHASTFGGNPLVTRVAQEVFAILEEGLLEKVSIHGQEFELGLAVLKKKFSFIQDIRGKGLMLAMDLDIDAQKLGNKCRDNFFLVNAIGNKTIRFLPPLIIEDQEIEEALERLSRSMANF
jgi:predicted acetylornithine/succinylornithine family transaminase